MNHSDPKKKKKAKPVTLPTKKGNEILGNSSPNSRSSEDDKATEQPDELIPKSVQQDHGGPKRALNPGPDGEL